MTIPYPHYSVPKERYDKVAVVFHWLVAIVILLAFASRIIAAELLPREYLGSFMQIHKSLGITALVLVVMRLVWRLFHPAPAMQLSNLERIISVSVHWLLYVLMLGIPFVGWSIVSASQRYPTLFFGLFQVPDLWYLTDLGERKKATVDFYEGLHSAGAWLLLALLIFHAAAALKHQFILKDGLMRRMWFR